MDIFSIMPVEVFMDDRLSKTELRVLGAILSFRNKNTNLCWPKREQISERCGLSLPKISTATSGLVALGWLQKEGNGGRSKSASYKLNVPDFIPKTVPNSGTVTNSGTVPNSGTKTVPDSGRGIKQTIEQTIINNNNSARENCENFTILENNSSTKTDSLDGSNSDNRKAKNPVTTIKRDWQPDDRCFELIARAGIPRVFADGLIDEFIFYWEERGDKRASWGATFLNNAKQAWQREQQKSLGDQHSQYRGLTNNGANYDRKPKISESEWHSFNF